MDIEDVVMKLIGPVQATGSHGEDEKRLENLKQLTGLVDSLLFRISQAATDAGRQEYSMRKIGEHARGFLQDVNGSFDRYPPITS